MPKDPDPIDVAIGRKIASRRLVCGLNQTELGRAAGVTFQQIQKYEKGTNRVSGSRMCRIAECLGVEPDYFFPKKDGSTAPQATATDQLGASRGGHELAQLYMKMRPDCRDSLLSVARALAGPSAGQLHFMANA